MRPYLLLAFAMMALPIKAPAQDLAAVGLAKSAREQATEAILTERTSQVAFDKAIADARKLGVAEQVLLEARFLYHVDLGQSESIAAMLPDLMKQHSVFKLVESEIFSAEEDWLAVLEYVQAIAALNKGDTIAFKRHITEAFWLSPAQAAAYAPHIEAMRMKETMARVVFDFDQTVLSLEGGEPVALSKFIKENKAMLVHFWSPWSRECIEAMDDFISIATLLSKHGVAIVSLHASEPLALTADARQTIRATSGVGSGAWLLDSEEHPLSQLLRVRRLPTLVIVSAEGKVLFNGTSSEELFWKTLREINPRIDRSALSKVSE